MNTDVYFESIFSSLSMVYLVLFRRIKLFELYEFLSGPVTLEHPVYIYTRGATIPGFPPIPGFFQYFDTKKYLLPVLPIPRMADTLYRYFCLVYLIIIIKFVLEKYED